MKKFYFLTVVLCALAVWCGFNFQADAQNNTDQTPNLTTTSPNFVISGFQVAGGSATDEFIELQKIGFTLTVLLT